jgi:hypothetical protein
VIEPPETAWKYFTILQKELRTEKLSAVFILNSQLYLFYIFAANRPVNIAGGRRQNTCAASRL